MKRLTNHERDWYNEPGCNYCSAYCYECCVHDGYIKECVQRLTWLRLVEIEDILGDEYDLQMLKNYFTLEREECSCNGNPEKCNFYPEKRKENKTMNTAEMYLQAQKDGMCYKIVNKEKCSEDLFYQKDKGFFDIYGDTCYTNIWNYFDDMMQEQWMLNTMTKAEAERALGVKIID